MTPEDIKAEINRLTELLNATQARTEGHEGATSEGKPEPESATLQAEQGGAGSDDPTFATADEYRAYVARTAKPAGASSAPQERQETLEATERGDAPKGLIESVAFSQQGKGGNIVESGVRSIVRARVTTERDYRMETTAEMCRRVSEGESMQKICKEPDMPSVGTFLRWCHDDAEIGQMYIVALRLRAAGHAEELLIDLQKLDKCTEAHEVQALKVKINTRQWIMSRLLPKQYGDHQIIEHTGEVKLDEKQIDARLKHLVGRIKGSSASPV